MARVLLAEPHPVLRTLIEKLLQKAGHAVDTVEKGEAVLPHLDGESHGALIIGAPLLLNEHDKKTLLQYIEEENAEVTPRIIVLTARTLDRELLRRAARLQVCAVISEPFDNDELLATIDACARNLRPRQRFLGFRQATLRHAFGDDTPLLEW